MALAWFTIRQTNCFSSCKAKNLRGVGRKIEKQSALRERGAVALVALTAQ